MNGQRQDDEQASESGCDVIAYVYRHVTVASLPAGVSMPVGVTFRVLKYKQYLLIYKTTSKNQTNH